jgi:hypothetical protein
MEKSEIIETQKEELDRLRKNVEENHGKSISENPKVHKLRILKTNSISRNAKAKTSTTTVDEQPQHNILTFRNNESIK